MGIYAKAPPPPPISEEEQAPGREFPKVKVVAVVAAMLMLAAVGLSTLSTSTAA